MSGPTGWRAAPELTLTEAARVLGWSHSLTYDRAQAGVLPTHRDRLGRMRVKPADLEPILARQETEQEPDLFSTAPSVMEELTAWLASVADPDGVIRDPDALAMIQEALSDD